MRIELDLPRELVQRIDDLCAKERKTRDGIIRAAVGALLEREAAFRLAVDEAFGMWKDRELDGLELERQLRAEWERNDPRL